MKNLAYLLLFGCPVALVQADVQLVDSSCGTQEVAVQYRADQQSAFVPSMDPTDRLSTIDRPVLQVRTAYTDELNPGGKNTYSLTGVRKRGNHLQLATDAGQEAPWGTSVTLGCEGGVYSGAAVINTAEKLTSIIYGGPHVQFGYTYKWPLPTIEGGIAVDFASHIPYFNDLEGTAMGGDVALLFRFQHKNTGEVISLMHRAYALSENQGFPDRYAGVDPNDNAHHFATHFGGSYSDSKGPVGYGYVRLLKGNSPVFTDRFSATVTPGHLERAAAEAGLPSDAREWGLQHVSVRFEVNDNGGPSITAGAFSDLDIRRLDDVNPFEGVAGKGTPVSGPGIPDKGTPTPPKDVDNGPWCPGNKWQRQRPPCGRAVPFYEE